MYKLIARANEVKEHLQVLNVSKKEKIKIGLLSFLLGLVIVMGPTVLLINCLIFNDHINFVIFGIVVCLFVLCYVCQIFYYQGISCKRVPDLKSFYLLDGLYWLFFIIVTFLLILII